MPFQDPCLQQNTSVISKLELAKQLLCRWLGNPEDPSYTTILTSIHCLPIFLPYMFLAAGIEFSVKMAHPLLSQDQAFLLLFLVLPDGHLRSPLDLEISRTRCILWLVVQTAGKRCKTPDAGVLR